jgi:hypothetical protein
MKDAKRIRLVLDAETYELHHYFAQLRGRSLGWHLRRVLALYAQTAEQENPPLRAHMLAWREAKKAEQLSDADPEVLPF